MRKFFDGSILFDEMLTKINSLERNISELIELKTQYENFAKYAQILIVEFIKQKKGYQRSKTNLMK